MWPCSEAFVPSFSPFPLLASLNGMAMFRSFLFPVSVPFPLLASLNGVAMFSLSHDVTLVNTITRYCKCAVQCTLYCLQCKYTSISLYSLTGGRDQREGLGLIEYQAMPSLRDVAHDGWLCTFIILQISWKFRQLPAGSSCQGKWYITEKTGSMACPSHTKSNLPGHSSPASQAGRRVGPAL